VTPAELDELVDALALDAVPATQATRFGLVTHRASLRTFPTARQVFNQRGDTDLDLYSATEGTGVEDTAISALTEVQLINAGTQSSGTVTAAASMPAANTDYLYLVGQGTANAAYTAGKFLIELYGI
jgi:hypothetical protein